MNLIRVSKGHDLPLEGRPATDLDVLPKPSRVAVLPERISFVKPKLMVKEADAVSIGTPLFHDKRHPRVRFLSPGGGVVEAIEFGPRRVIRKIVIRLDETEAADSFPPFDEGRLRRTDRRELVGALLDGGLWPLLRALPYRDYPDPEAEPPAIIVTLADDEPFKPDPAVYLAGRQDLFGYGMQVLARLAPRVFVPAPASANGALQAVDTWITHAVSGPYPALDPGVFVYHTRRSPADNRAWFVSGQDVLLIAGLLRDGRYPTERIVAIGGPAAGRRRHAAVRMGAPLKPLADLGGEASVRCIVGGVLRGFTGDPDGYFGYFETALNLVPVGDHREFMALVRPGYRKATFSRAFLSVLNRDTMPMDCNLHGELRPCVACNACSRVCPVDILPQLTYKSLLADDIEEALAHGLLDCVECGLCSYVCPAKIELCDHLTRAKRRYHQEQTAA
jgi:Na+-transporting NADH:ubiquinone oxidoreductase subunit A